MQSQKKTGSTEVRSKFQGLRQQIKADINKQHDLYVNKLVDAMLVNPKHICTSVGIPTVRGKSIKVYIKGNPKYFYRYTNSQKKDNQGIPPFKRRNGSGLAESETGQAEEFNDQFTDAFSKTSESEAPLLEKSSPPMSDMHVSNEGIIKMMKGLNSSKALGPDELYPRVLKELWLTSAHFIKKAASLYQVTIVQCPWHVFLARCFEHIVCTNIMAHLDEHKLLSDRQHAFSFHEEP